MKKLILYLFGFVLLLSTTNAQSFERKYFKGDGVSWADSLFATASDSTLYTMPDGSTQASDTSKVYTIDKLYEWYSITVEDTGSSTTDTIEVWLGQIVHNEAKTAIDTLYRIAVLRDTAWDIITQPLVNAGAITTYFMYDPVFPSADLLKVEYINADWVANRRTKLFHNAVRRR